MARPPVLDLLLRFRPRGHRRCRVQAARRCAPAHLALALAVVLSGLAGAAACGGPDPSSAEILASARRCTPGRPCDDGDACTAGDACNGGGICRGTRYSCDDGNACTGDTCDGAGGCTHAFSSGPCDDGDACTSGDGCSAGACVGTPYSCDDGDACTADLCDGAGGCSSSEPAGSCDDIDACTYADACTAAGCAGTPYSCQDGDPCTSDACDGAGGCWHSPAWWGACDDGDPGTKGDICWDGTCAGYPPEVCANGVDDDCDGLPDSLDAECMSGCSPREDCSTPADDDCDGLVNGDDWDDCVDAGWGCWPGTGWVAANCNQWCIPHCFDGQWSGAEGDVDCGGACDAKCQPGQHCYSPYDCASGQCLDDVCT